MFGPGGGTDNDVDLTLMGGTDDEGTWFGEIVLLVVGRVTRDGPTSVFNPPVEAPPASCSTPTPSVLTDDAPPNKRRHLRRS